jgi:dihydroorotate dehydrogenase (NAD+) catalytic subunit
MMINIGDLKLKNPVMTASGTFGFGREYGQLMDIGRLGAIVVKGITIEPRKGNPLPRVVETPSGILNSVGLENPGVEGFISEELPYLMEMGVPVIVNINGENVKEFGFLAARLSKEKGIAALEVNISCPNVAKGGMAFGTDSETAAGVVHEVKQNTDLPVIVKLTPNVTDIVEVALGVEKAGADAISLINTLLGMSIDIKSRRSRLGKMVGGLSGPAVKPIALRMVWQVAKAVKIPVIGMGGIMKWEDAVEFLLAGASAVAIGTGSFVNPLAALQVIDGIEKYMSENGMLSMKEITGKMVC